MVAVLAELKRPALPVVILSTADISAPIWTNKQHIATRLAADREVHYIESLGLRAPSLNWKDIQRVAERGATAARRSASFPQVETTGANGVEALKLHSPMIVPFHAYAPIRWLNRQLIDRSVARCLPARYVLWSFSPLTYGLEAGADKVVYHSVDLLHTLPGIPEATLLAAERELIIRADAVIASSRGVADHLRHQGAQPLLWENVADVELFRAARSNERERRAIFVGNLTPSKVDFGILEALAARGVRLALAGPTSIDGTRRDPALDKLLRCPSVEYLGVLSQKEMAAELGRSRVGIIPYYCNGYTSGVFPMKVYEYLAAGLPVVATPLSSLAGKALPGLIVADAARFADDVAAICAGPYREPPGDYSANSWDARLGQVRALLSADRNG